MSDESTDTAPSAPDLSVWDAEKLPIMAPTGTPSPLREVYAAVAEAVFNAWEARYSPTFDAINAFKEAIAVPLTNALGNAGTMLAQNEIWLQAHAPEAFAAFQAAMEEAKNINHACGYVILGQVNASPTAYLAAQRPFDAYSLMGRIRKETCLAAARHSQPTSAGDVSDEYPKEAIEALEAAMLASHSPRESPLLARRAPITSLAKLLEFAEKRRAEIDLDGRNIVILCASASDLAWLWESMAAMGGTLPPRPPVVGRDWLAAAPLRDGQTLEGLRAEAVFDAYNEVIQFCEERIKGTGGGSDGKTNAKASGLGKKAKRSTQKGEAQVKLISALTAHHKYADGGCQNQEPIGNNELADRAGVDKSTSSDFFAKFFQSKDEKGSGHAKYQAICRRNFGKVLDVLKLMNNEFSVDDLYGGTPPNETERHG